MTFAAAQDKNVNKVVGPPYKLMKYFYFMSLSDVKQLGIKAMLEDIAHFKNGCKIAWVTKTNHHDFKQKTYRQFGEPLSFFLNIIAYVIYKSKNRWYLQAVRFICVSLKWCPLKVNFFKIPMKEFVFLLNLKAGSLLTYCNELSQDL